MTRKLSSGQGQGQGKASEYICDFKCDNHLISASGAWFHANHINLRIGVMHITAGESSEIFCRWLAKTLLSRWIKEGDLDRVLYNTLRTIVEEVVSFVSLQQEF